MEVGQISDSTSSSGASTVSSLRTSEEGSHGTSCSDSRPDIGRGATHGTLDRQDVGFVIRIRPENLTSKNGTEEGQKNTVTSNYFATATTFDDLNEDAVEHLMMFLTAEDVVALGQTCVKWRDICQPEWRKKKPKEMSAAWSRVDYIPTEEQVATVELLLAHGLLTISTFLLRPKLLLLFFWLRMATFRNRFLPARPPSLPS